MGITYPQFAVSQAGAYRPGATGFGAPGGYFAQPPVMQFPYPRPTPAVAAPPSTAQNSPQVRSISEKTTLATSTPPATTPHQHNEKQGLQALQVIKVVYSGLSGAAAATLLFGAPFKQAFGASLLQSIGECLLARKIYAAQSPWAAKILAFSNRLVGGPNKLPCDLTPEEKNRCLAPISALGSVLGCLAVAGVNYAMITSRKGKPAGLPYPVLQHQFRQSAGMQKALAGLRLVGHAIDSSKPVRWLQKNPKMLFVMAVASGLFWGGLEGLAAQKIAKPKPH